MVYAMPKKSDSRIEEVHTCLDPVVVEALDRMVSDGLYSNRSEAVHDVLENVFSHSSNKETEKSCFLCNEQSGDIQSHHLVPKFMTEFFSELNWQGRYYRPVPSLPRKASLPLGANPLRTKI
ncbi:hypothetical protein AKJ48_02885 [candidate division MSBL1 archaeon SCGC-AAA261O19]|uniref:Uncharacterized protein n=2 Tax=candidate division MSBL1 TaxID=215777 RepID=A0A133VD34_9EURY|nr:hypothetical protein AKJ48_02885 [candidate division MSBL1 archaeon SCGC-AAA261O19]